MLITQSYVSTVVVNARMANKITLHTPAKAIKIGNFNEKCPFFFFFNKTILAHAQS
jgi:hypothetical protein